MKIIENLISRYCSDGVEYVDLGEVVVFTDGHSFSSGSFTESGEYQVVKITDIFGGLVNRGKTFINELPEKLKNGQQLSGGEILVAMSGSTGKTGYNTLSNAVVNQRIAILRNQDCIENGYLKHLLVNGTFETYCFKNGTGPQNNISKAQLLRYRIPLPPLPIQQEIVRILDTFTNLTAELTNKLNAELTARRKQYEYYRDELLTFGEDVSRVQLGLVCDFKYGKGNNIPNETGEYPVYGCNGIVSTTNTFNSEDAPIIGHIGSAGVVNWGKGKHFVTYNGTICRVKADKIRSRYAYYVLNSLHLERFVKGSQPFLSYGDFSKVLIPLPPIERQDEIVRILDQFDYFCNDLTSGIPAEISARQKQYEYYRNQLLTFKQIGG